MSQNTISTYKNYTIGFLTDSLFDPSYTTPVAPHEMAPKVLANKLNKLGCSVQSRCFGKAGEASSQFIGRADLFHLYGTPDIGVLLGGTNDYNLSETGTCPATGTSNKIYLKSSANAGKTQRNSWQGQVITLTGGTGSGQTNTIIDFAYDSANARGIATLLNNWVTIPDGTTTYSIAASTQANIQANLQGCIKIFKYGVTGYGAGLGLGTSFYSQSQLPADGRHGQRFLIYHDTSSNGGVREYANTDQHATITTNLSSAPAQSVWEYRNPQGGELGWGRVAVTGTPAWATSKIILVDAQYLNFDTAGYDNYNVTAGTGTKFPDYVTLRTTQLAAATAEAVVYSGAYNFQSMSIYGGTYKNVRVSQDQVQGSAAWYILQGTYNRHLSRHGHERYADLLVCDILNEDWISDLK